MSKFVYLILVLTLNLLIITPNYGANLLLRCLAKEEEKIHKEKKAGVLYRINQEFLNELATNNDITIKTKFVNEICHSSTQSPTILFLKLLLIEESNIYDLSLNGVDPSMRSFKQGYINEFQKQIPRIFVQYLSGLQSEMPTFDCLSKFIPELNTFNEKLKYLEDEINNKFLIKDKKLINTIFKKLENIKSYKKECSKKAKNK